LRGCPIPWSDPAEDGATWWCSSWQGRRALCLLNDCFKEEVRGRLPLVLRSPGSWFTGSVQPTSSGLPGADFHHCICLSSSAFEPSSVPSPALCPGEGKGGQSVFTACWHFWRKLGGQRRSLFPGICSRLLPSLPRDFRELPTAPSVFAVA
jgi:hypothetical protein